MLYLEVFVAMSRDAKEEKKYDREDADAVELRERE